MSHRSEVRKAELVAIQAARDLMANLRVAMTFPEGEEPPTDTQTLDAALKALDNLGLLEAGRAKSSRGATVSSKQAAIWMDGDKARGLSAQIVRYLWRDLYRGGTVPELIRWTQRPHQSVSARVNELRDNGWVLDSGRTRTAHGGHPAAVWTLTARAIGAIGDSRG